MASKQVTVSAIIDMLKSGYTRWEKDATEDMPSIQKELGLSAGEAREIFSEPALKNVKTCNRLEIIDDTKEVPTTRVIYVPVIATRSNGTEVEVVEEPVAEVANVGEAEPTVPEAAEAILGE